MPENEPPEYPAYGSTPDQGSALPPQPPEPEPERSTVTGDGPQAPPPHEPPPAAWQQGPQAGWAQQPQAGWPQQPQAGWPQQPQAGWPQQPQAGASHFSAPQYYAPPPTSQKALWSMILGISALASIPLCAGFFGLAIGASIAAIVMGAQAKGEIAQSQGAVSGSGQAQAGFITGIVGTVLLGIGLVFFIGLFASI